MNILLRERPPEKRLKEATDGLGLPPSKFGAWLWMLTGNPRLQRDQAKAELLKDE